MSMQFSHFIMEHIREIFGVIPFLSPIFLDLVSEVDDLGDSWLNCYCYRLFTYHSLGYSKVYYVI